MTATPPGLHDRPVLVLDPGMHTAPIKRADVDRDGHFAVTASEDKTVRIWSLTDGRLERTIRLPAGPGDVGKAYAVAISPDGMTVAAGGWTRWTETDPQEQIYLFDRASGAMTGRIDGLPASVCHLAFSGNGRRLAAVLWHAGLRVYERDEDRWRKVVEDADYDDQSYGVAFAADGRLATTSYDHRLRLYNSDGELLCSNWAPHACPFGLAFNPIDGRLAVGFDDSTDVWLYSGTTLTALQTPDLDGIDNGNLGRVAWSADGRVLFAAGKYWDGRSYPALAWDDGGAGPRRVLLARRNTVTSLGPLPDGTILVTAADPWLAVLADDGTPRWAQVPKQIDARGQRSNLAVSSDGMLLEFGLKEWGEDRLRFDVATLRLIRDPADDGRTVRPKQDGLAVADWINDDTPRLNGVPLPLEPYETSRSLAIAPDGKHFLLGSEWWLRAFNATGAELWRREVPGIVWAVNVAGDGRVAVAAYGDGTIRWHRMEDGGELLALFPMLDRENWVVWTPEGVYATTPRARDVLRWHVNRGWDAAGEAIPVWDIPETYRPDVIPHVLPQLGTAGAIAVAELGRIRAAIQRATGSGVAPGARLHVLAIGVSDYGEAARHLDLAYAHQDARDIAAALRSSQSSLYARVLVSELVDREATKEDIIRELRAIRDAMRGGNGSDLAVIVFSGHGELVEGDRFYLLPHGVVTSSTDAIEDSALSSVQFHDLVAAIAQHGRAILFIDACRSGGATAPLDRSLRAMLAAPNVTVFTSSKAGETSVERADWQNGAFTEALLEALTRADADRDGLIRISDLSGYLSERVPALTDGAQRPDVEIHFDAKILVATA